MNYRSLWLLLLLAIWATISLLTGQTTNGIILGVVSDPSGASVPGAAIKVTNELTGVSRDVASDSTGLYQVLSLPVGRYSINVSAPGFQPTTFTGVTLQVQQTARFDITLKVQQQAEAITVSAQGPLLDQDSAVVGAVIDNRRLIELPLNGRNFNQLSLLSPGVVQSGSGGQSIGFGGQLGLGISTNGTRFNDQNYLIDGMSNYSPWFQSTSIDVSLDMIQEFKLQTSTYSAEYGLGAANVSVAFKSGTNSFHGSAYEYLRNPHFNARNFFSPGPQVLRRNQFGGALGGPIVRNRTFFFFGYEGVRQRQAALASGQVPTVDERQGKMKFTVRDPLTGQPFPNNVIPPTRLDPVAQLVLQKFVPLPNSGPDFVFYTASSPLNNNQYGLKIDHLFSSKDTISGRYMRYRQNSEPVFGVGLMDYNNTYFATHTAVTWTHSFSPAMINDLRASYRREALDQSNILPTTKQPYIFNKEAGIKTLDDVTSGAPFFGVPGIGGGSLGSFFVPAVIPFDTYELSDNISYVRGRHTYKAGFNAKRTWQRTYVYIGGRGTYQYNGSYTGLPLADFLIGAPALVTAADSPPVSYLRWGYISAFFQDDWKVTPTLTLNLGLRWGVDTPPYEKNDQFSAFSFPLGKIVVAGKNGSYPVATNRLIVDNNPQSFTRAKDAGYPLRSLRDTNWKDFDPRFGFSWRPFSKTILRGGYGITHTPRNAFAFFSQAFSAPFNGRSYSATNTMPIPTVDVKDPFRGLPQATVSFVAGAVSPGTYFPRYNPTGYVQQFSFGIQRALSQETKLEVNYVGSNGTHMAVQYPYVNDPPPGPGPVQPRRPFPGLGPFASLENNGKLLYNSLQASLTQRFSAGLSLSSAFTWGRAMDTDGWLTNRQLSRAPSAYDVKARWVTSYVYELPFGKGKRFLNRRGVVDGIIGGWQLSGIFTLQSGLPYTVSVSGDPANVGQSSDRPDRLASGITSQRTLERWFDPNAFVAPGDTELPPAQRKDYHHGNSGRDILYANGREGWDSGLFKNFRITENHKLEFRFEAFNLPNHPDFNAPSASLISTKVPGKTTADLNPNLGRVSSAAAPRILQMALRYVF